MSEFYDPADPTDEVEDSSVMPGFDLSDVPLPPEDDKKPSPVRTRSRGRRSSVELPKDAVLPTPPTRRSSALHSSASKKDSPISTQTKKHSALPTPPHKKDVLEAPHKKDVLEAPHKKDVLEAPSSSSKKELLSATPPTRRSQRGKRRESGHTEDSLNVVEPDADKKDSLSDAVDSKDNIPQVPLSHKKNAEEKSEQSTPCTRGKLNRFGLKNDEGKGKVSFHIKTNKKSIAQSVPLESSKHSKKLDEELDVQESSDVQHKVGQIIATKKPMYLPNYDDDEDDHTLAAADKCLVLLQKVQQKSLETKAKNSEEKILSSIQPIPELARNKVKLVPYDDDNGDSEKDTDSPFKDKLDKQSDQSKGKTRSGPPKSYEYSLEQHKTNTKERDSSRSPSSKRKTRSTNERESSRSPSNRRNKSKYDRETSRSPITQRKTKSTKGRENSRSPSSKRKTRSTDDRESSKSPVSTRKTRSGNELDTSSSSSSKKKTKSRSKGTPSSPPLKQKHKTEDEVETAIPLKERRKTRSSDDRESSRSPIQKRKSRITEHQELSSSPTSRRKSKSCDDSESSPTSRRKSRSTEDDTTYSVSKSKGKKGDEKDLPSSKSLRKNTESVDDKRTSAPPYSATNRRFTDERESSSSPSSEQRMKSLDDQEFTSSPSSEVRKKLTTARKTSISPCFEQRNRSASEIETCESPVLRNKSIDDTELPSSPCFAKNWSSSERETSRSPSVGRQRKHKINRESSKLPASKEKHSSNDNDASESSGFRRKHRPTDRESSSSPTPKWKVKIADELEISKSPNSRRKLRADDEKENSRSPVSSRKAKDDRNTSRSPSVKRKTRSGERNTSRSPSERRKTRSGERYERRKSRRSSPTQERYRRRYSPKRRSKSPHSPPRRRRSPEWSRRRKRYSRSPTSRSPDKYRRRYSPRRSSLSPEFKYSRSPERGRRYRYSPRLSSSPDSPDRFGRSRKRYRMRYSSPVRSRSPIYKKYDDKHLKDKPSKKSDSDATAMSDFDIMSIPLPDSGQPSCKQTEEHVVEKSAHIGREIKKEKTYSKAIPENVSDVPLPDEIIYIPEKQKSKHNITEHIEHSETIDLTQPGEKNDESGIIFPDLETAHLPSTPSSVKSEISIKKPSIHDKQKAESKISFKLKLRNSKGKIEEMSNKSVAVFPLSDEDDGHEVREDSRVGTGIKPSLETPPVQRGDTLNSGTCDLIETCLPQPASIDNTLALQNVDISTYKNVNAGGADLTGLSKEKSYPGEEHKSMDIDEIPPVDIATCVTREILDTNTFRKETEARPLFKSDKKTLKSETCFVNEETKSSKLHVFERSTNIPKSFDQMSDVDKGKDAKSGSRRHSHRKSKKSIRSDFQNVEIKTEPVAIQPEVEGKTDDKPPKDYVINTSELKKPVTSNENVSAYENKIEQTDTSAVSSESAYVTVDHSLSTEKTKSLNVTQISQISEQEKSFSMNDRCENNKPETDEMTVSSAENHAISSFKDGNQETHENATLTLSRDDKFHLVENEEMTHLTQKGENMTSQVELEENEKKDDEISSDMDVTDDEIFSKTKTPAIELKENEKQDSEKTVELGINSSEEALTRDFRDEKFKTEDENVDETQHDIHNDDVQTVYPFAEENVNNSAISEFSTEDNSSVKSSTVVELNEDSSNKVEKIDKTEIENSELSVASEDIRNFDEPKNIMQSPDHSDDNGMTIANEPSENQQPAKITLHDNCGADLSDDKQVESITKASLNPYKDTADGNNTLPMKILPDESEVHEIIDEVQKKTQKDNNDLKMSLESNIVEPDISENVDFEERDGHSILENEKSPSYIDTSYQKDVENIDIVDAEGEVHPSDENDKKLESTNFSTTEMRNLSDEEPEMRNLSDEEPLEHDKVCSLTFIKESPAPKHSENTSEPIQLSDMNSVGKEEEPKPQNETVDENVSNLDLNDKGDPIKNNVNEVIVSETFTSKLRENIVHEDINDKILVSENAELGKENRESNEIPSGLQKNDHFETDNTGHQLGTQRWNEDTDENKKQIDTCAKPLDENLHEDTKENQNLVDVFPKSSDEKLHEDMYEHKEQMMVYTEPSDQNLNEDMDGHKEQITGSAELSDQNQKDMDGHKEQMTVSTETSDKNLNEDMDGHKEQMAVSTEPSDQNLNEDVDRHKKHITAFTEHLHKNSNDEDVNKNKEHITVSTESSDQNLNDKMDVHREKITVSTEPPGQNQGADMDEHKEQITVSTKPLDQNLNEDSDEHKEQVDLFTGLSDQTVDGSLSVCSTVTESQENYIDDKTEIIDTKLPDTPHNINQMGSINETDLVPADGDILNSSDTAQSQFIETSGTEDECSKVSLVPDSTEISASKTGFTEINAKPQDDKSEELPLFKSEVVTHADVDKIGDKTLMSQDTEVRVETKLKDGEVEDKALKDDTSKPKPRGRFDQTAEDVAREKEAQERDTPSRRRSGRLRSLEEKRDERNDEKRDERKDSRSQDKDRRGRDDRRDRDRRDYDDRRDSHRRDRRRHDDDDRSYRDDRRRGRDYDRYDRRDRDSHRRRGRDEYDDDDYDSRSSKRQHSRHDYKDRKLDRNSDSVDSKKTHDDESSNLGPSRSEPGTSQFSQNQTPYQIMGTSDNRDDNTVSNQVKPEKVKSRWRRSCEAEMNDNEYPVADTGSPSPPSQALVSTPTPLADVTQTIEEKDASSTTTEIVAVPYFEELEENLYLAERRRSKQMKEVRRMVCDCTTSLEDRENGIAACEEDCLNRMLLIECGSRCPCGEFCQNKRFQKHERANVSVFQTEYKGHGLWANVQLQPGQFIMEYVGEVLDYKQFKSRTKIYAKSGSEHYYFMALNGDEIIDATSKGNISRFINHSCDPNCETQKWTVNGYLRVGFFTKKEIAPGEELTFDYQFEIYGREPQKCFCGTPKCRGFLGQKSTPLKSKKKSVRETEESEDADTEADVEQEKKKNELFEDECFEEELEKISEIGLHKKEDVLMLCRLMVRAEKENHRQIILRIIQETKEAVCLRLFLEYHGLSLLWSWMTDIGQGFIELKKQILSALKMLPIGNKTILEESKILSVVKRWAGELAKKELDSEKSEPTEITRSVVSTEMKDEEVSNESVPTLESTSANAVPVSILSTNKESKPAKKRVKFAIESSDSEVSAEFSDTALSDSDPQCSEVSASDSFQLNEDDQKSDEVKEYPTLKKRLKLAESSCDVIDDLEIHSASADTSHELSSDESKKVPQSSQVSTGEENKEVVKLGSEVSDDKVDSETSSPDDDSGSQDEEETMDVESKGEITNMAVDLLEQWSELKDIFKIPKKERVEERKRTERELDMRINEDSYGHYGGRGPSFSVGSFLSSSDWATGDRNDRKRRYEESPDKRKRDKHKKYDNEPRKSRFSPAIDPKLSKRERRELFEANVKSKDEDLKNYREELQRQREAYIQGQCMANPMYDPSYDPNLMDPHFPLGAILQDPAYAQEAGFEPDSAFQHDPGYLQNPNYSQMYPPDPSFMPPGGYPPDPNYPLPPSGPPPFPMDPALHGYPPMDSQQNMQPAAPPLMEQQMVPAPSMLPDMSKPPPSFAQQAPYPVPPPAPSLVPQPESFPVQPAPSPVQPPQVPSSIRPTAAGPSKKTKKAPPLPSTPPQAPAVPSLATPASVSAALSAAAVTKAQLEGATDAATTLALLQQVQHLQQQLQLQQQLAALAPKEEEEPPPPPSPPKPKQSKLPPNWKSAQDASGKTYFYHTVTRQTQWEAPTWDQGEREDMDLGTPKIFDEPASKSKKKTTTAAADTSSEVAKKIKELFRSKMSSFIVLCLNPYRKPECKVGRVTSTEDFKHLARKLTHHVMAKELKYCRHVEDLEVNESVKAKAKDYVKKYMGKFGPLYKNTGSPQAKV